jgi:bisphosphoglycerate-dependent phosphoglycerate mutase
MGGFVGLVMEIGADPSNANAAMEAFAAKSGQSLGYVKAQFKDYQAAESAAYDEAVQRARGLGQNVDRSILSNRESVRLLSEEMGVHLPRAVSGALAEILPGINAIGPALLGAFALAELPKFIAGLKDAATALGGYTDEVRKAEQADIDASNAALIHFTTIGDGARLIADTNRALADMASKQGDWTAEEKAANDAMTSGKSILLSLLGPVSAAIQLWSGYKAAVKEAGEGDTKAAELRQRLTAQLGEMTSLQDEQHEYSARIAKEAARAEKEAANKRAEAWERSTEQAYEYFARRRKLSQEEFEHYVRLSGELIRQEDRTREVEQETNAYFMEQQARLAHEQEEAITKGLEQADRRIEQQFKELIEHSKRLQIEWANEHPLLANITKDLKEMGIEAHSASVAKLELSAVTAQFTRATIDEIQAVQKSIAASGEQLAAGLAGLIGGRKAQAAVEAVWETARGIACLAEGAWPPNPAAIIAAGLHFEAAAQYALMAGRGSGHHGGAGAGSYGGSREDYSRGGSDSRGAYAPPQALAPGAGGGDGRFGELHVVVIGENEKAEWFAKGVNSAVDAGHFVQSTVSQRGAPVGH